MQDEQEGQQEQQEPHLQPTVLFPDTDTPFPVDDVHDGDNTPAISEEEEEEDEEIPPFAVFLNLCYHQAPPGRQLALAVTPTNAAITVLPQHPPTSADELPWPMVLAQRVNPEIDLSAYHSFVVRNQTMGYAYGMVVTHDNSGQLTARREFGCPRNHPHVCRFAVQCHDIQLQTTELISDEGVCRVCEMLVDDVQDVWHPAMYQQALAFFGNGAGGEDGHDDELSEEE
jgi:hypothetical protein